MNNNVSINSSRISKIRSEARQAYVQTAKEFVDVSKGDPNGDFSNLRKDAGHNADFYYSEWNDEAGNAWEKIHKMLYEAEIIDYE